MDAIPYRELFAGHIDMNLRTAARVLKAYPASSAAFARLAKGLKEAENRREKSAGGGIEVPPLMIVSTTEACNLACAGCYACARQRTPNGELSDARTAQILDEASALGVCIVMLAGGEPLLSHGWLEAMGGHEDMLGIVFTNGTLFDARRAAWFGGHRHMLPVFSIEGGEAETDARRGGGVFARVGEAMRMLREMKIPFGVSVTVTSGNLCGILDDAFVDEFMEKGCRLFIFVEYVPADPGSEPLALSGHEKKRLGAFATACAKKHPALFIPFPGDEEEYGGCLAAGRGFVHVSACGDLEPCPFAPFSDMSLKDVPLKDALASGFLKKVRENHHLLKEGGGGCAIWRNREWLAELAREEG